MTLERKWIQAATIAVDTETGAILVTGIEGGGGGGYEVVGLKDAAGVRISPAKEDGNLADIAARLLNGSDSAAKLLADVLAKLADDPATQTTLAAVLAKLPSDPATQTTLASVATNTKRLAMAAPITYATTGTAAEQVQAASQPCIYVRVMAGVNLTTGAPLNTVPVGVGISGTGNQKVPVMPNNFEGVILPVDNVNKLYVISPGGSGQTVVVVPYVVAS